LASNSSGSIDSSEAVKGKGAKHPPCDRRCDATGRGG
jgi:hypothetical protein